MTKSTSGGMGERNGYTRWWPGAATTKVSVLGSPKPNQAKQTEVTLKLEIPYEAEDSG